MKNRGFSLMELLAAIAIIAVLASLLLGATSNARKNADRTQALSNLRQVGVGLLSYTGENNGLLPGKLFPGQIPVNDPSDEDTKGRLATLLAPYIGISDPTVKDSAKLMIPPAFRRENIDPDNGRTYVMNMAMPMEDGTVINVWGSRVGNDPTSEGPKPINQIPQRSWLMSDADQLHPRVTSAPWKEYTPKKPIHGVHRQVLFSDGSAGTATQEELM